MRRNSVITRVRASQNSQKYDRKLMAHEMLRYKEPPERVVTPTEGTPSIRSAVGRDFLVPLKDLTFMKKLSFAFASVLLVSIAGCGGEATDDFETQDTQDSIDLQLEALADKPACVLTTVNLYTAAPFAVLAGSTVTNTGLTTVTGNLGVSPGTTVTGSPTVIGTQHLGNPTAAQAQADLTVAYNDAAGRKCRPVSVAGNLGGLTLAPGLYTSTGSLEVSSGDLTLDGKGNANSVFIFQMATTLSTTPGRQVFLTNGAQAANVFWQVGSSASIGTTSVFKGSIMAYQAIALQTGAKLDGRALARVAAVTMDNNVVTKP